MKRLIALLVAAIALLTGPAAMASDVYIVPGSEVNLVARDGRIPITIKNESSESATIIVHGKASSFRLEVLKETEPELHESIMALASAWGANAQESEMAKRWDKLKKIAIDYSIAEPAAKKGLVAGRRFS